MTDSQRMARNTARLKECWPAFGIHVRTVITALEADGFRPRIQEAWRSPAQQLAAFNAGNSKLKWGFHNATGADGQPESLAVDVLDDSHPLNPPIRYLIALAHHAGKQGLVTGISWGLPTGLEGPVSAMIAAYPFEPKQAVRIGWDPTHVQPLGLSVSDARAGKRI